MSVVSSWPAREFEAGILCRDGSGLMYILPCDGVLKLFSYSAADLRWCHETPPPGEVRQTSGDNSLVPRSSPWRSNIRLKFHSDKFVVGTRVCRGFWLGEGVYIIALMLRFRTSEGLWWG